MTAMAWFYGGEQAPQGPVQDQELENLVRSRRIIAATLVRAHNMPNWIQAGYLPLFQQLFARVNDEGAMSFLVPTGPQSGLAMAAGYCGLFGLLMIPAPLGILFGVLGLRDIARHPEKRGKGRAITGIVLGTIFCVVYIGVFVTAGASKH